MQKLHLEFIFLSLRETIRTMKRISLILIGVAALISISAFGQNHSQSKALELGWMELPDFSEDESHFLVSHYTEEYWGRQRNYSLYWDIEHQVASWLAYPMNQKLLGKGNRSGAWQYDSFLSTRKQPNLRRTYQAGSAEGYIRGHLLPSSDRLSPEMNQQTFFYTNIVPQDPYLNDGLWKWLEDEAQRIALDADNAWIVTGCICSDPELWVTDYNGKRVSVPTHFYKIVLTLKDDHNPETIDYVATCWLVENRNYGFSGFEAKAAECRRSVNELEELTGWDFWVNLEAILGTMPTEIVEGRR